MQAPGAALLVGMGATRLHGLVRNHPHRDRFPEFARLRK
jgi:hypothetical protein